MKTAQTLIACVSSALLTVAFYQLIAYRVY